MPMPDYIEGRVASLSDAVIDSGSITVSGGPVSVTDAGGEPVTAVVVGSQSGVSDNVLTTLITLTANGIDRLVQISCSGTAYAKFQLFINTVLKETRRSGPDRNLYFLYNHPIELTSGDVVDLKVTHYNVGETADFEATVYGFHS